MTSRVLPPEEWAKLEGTELKAVWGGLDPGNTLVVVVEDDGQIVGCWAVIRYVHVEGLWIAPSHRKRIGVARRLFQAMRCAARTFGARAVITNATSDDVRRLLTHVHAQQLPGESYAFGIMEQEPCQQQ